MFRIIRLIFVLFIVISGLAIHLRNDQTLILDYYLGGVELPFSLFLIMALCVGLIIGFLSLFPALIRLKRQNAYLSSRLKTNEQELNNLRVMPLKNTY